MALFSFLPYLPSLVLWLSITFSLYVLILYRIAPHPTTIWLALAFPGAFQNLIHGQNAFLTTVIIGAGFLLFEGRPLFAGITFGLLIYKPQFALLFPFAS